MQERCAAHQVVIDRSVFYPIMDKNVMQFPDGSKRNLHRTEYDRYVARKVTDGLYDIRDIYYHELADNGQDLLPGVRQFEVTAFTTSVPEPTTPGDELDLASGTHPYINKANPMRSLFGNILAAKK